MAPTMRAFRLLEWGRPAELVEAPLPDPAMGQVRVRVAGCGLCHSDLAMMVMASEVGQALGWQRPFTLGHETAGWIDALGPSTVLPGGLAVGDPVALASPASCGTCRWCRAGRENLCREGAVGRGYGRDGGLADAVLVDDVRALVPLAGLDPSVAGPLTDAGATSHHAVRRALPRVRDNGTVVVLGAGGLGAFVLQILRARRPEARLVAVDPDPARRAVAVSCGADVVIDRVGEGTGRELRDLLGPDGADATLDLVGTDDTIRAAVRATGPGGAVGIVGAAGGTLRRPWYGTLPRDGEVFTFQGSDLIDVAEVVALAAAGEVRVDTVGYALDDVVAAYAALEAGGLPGRLVVRP